MADETIPTPHLFQGVMVSGTFRDLRTHRARLLDALQKERLFAIGMEGYVPVPGEDVLSSSLNMVREASAYVGLISHRYGQVVEDPERNPHAYSVSRLEFEEAQHLGLPTLVFIMGGDHDVKQKDVETEAEKIKQLEAYRERAQEGRIYAVFNSLEEFTEKAIHAVASLRRYLEKQTAPPARAARKDAHAHVGPRDNPIPAPPAFYAEPSYIGSYEFVGRRAELERLTDWAAPADPHPVLLYEAIGGTGKSMLTWEWTTKHSTEVRQDWAGRFWYSFYEKGAVMADFCRRALAYITHRPLGELRRKKTVELGEQLLRHLQSRPWLLILDGLERVLVAYHRYDAAQLADEDVDTSKDQIAKRDPCAAIRPEDDDLLRMLASAAPSKLLITTRLTPRVLLNPSSQGIQGVLRVPLPGLRPADAERLIRACGVGGDSAAIQDYLKRHCDCHPLVTGVLAGLIKNYLPDRGNFDAWAADEAEGGGRLNLADLDLIQKRNHILLAALAALPEKSRQLLSTLALLSEAADYPTLSALNPHLPPEPEEVEVPEKPEDNWRWDMMSEKEREGVQENYREALRLREQYEQAVRARLESPELRSAPSKLVETVRDLESRGMLQYDPQTKRHDLHPVVRGVAAGKLRQEEKELYGQRVVDHFSRQAHNPYEEAETLDDVRYGLNIVRTLLQMGRYEQAYGIYSGALANALFFNLEAYAEILSLLRPFFPHGWDTLPEGMADFTGSYLPNDAGIALEYCGASQEALTIKGAVLTWDLRHRSGWEAPIFLLSIARVLKRQARLAKAESCQLLALSVATLLENDEQLFSSRRVRFSQLVTVGLWAEAEAMWQLLDPMGRNWSRAVYRPGSVEYIYARFRFSQGTLEEEHLAHAEHLARMGKSRLVVRNLHGLRGAWQLEQGRWAAAVESYQEAVRMAREVGQHDLLSEAALLLAKFRLGQISAPRDEAEQLASAKEPPHYVLAELWLAMGDRKHAKRHALAAYKAAWADGEPYVFRYDLNKARALLEQLGAQIPDLLPYDPAKDEKLPWEDEVAAAIERLRAEKEAEMEMEKKAKKAKRKRRPSSTS
jgi:tetratricopeptide (TPR) repeat protein